MKESTNKALLQPVGMSIATTESELGSSLETLVRYAKER
jgi:hypothetical protein